MVRQAHGMGTGVDEMITQMNCQIRIKAVLLTLVTLLGFVLSSSGSVMASSMREPIDYKQLSETTAYPVPEQVADLNILVKLKQNRVYIRSGNQVVYTMYCSGGINDPETHRSTTPVGHFKLQSQKGDSFYNSELQEGANYWTSFKDHGVYLFHTVPTDAAGNYKEQEAAKLGKQAASHGCIRLSIPDAQYIQTLPVNTPVTIEED